MSKNKFNQQNNRPNNQAGQGNQQKAQTIEAPVAPIAPVVEEKEVAVIEPTTPNLANVAESYLAEKAVESYVEIVAALKTDKEILVAKGEETLMLDQWIETIEDLFVVSATTTAPAAEIEKIKGEIAAWEADRDAAAKAIEEGFKLIFGNTEGLTISEAPGAARYRDLLAAECPHVLPATEQKIKVLSSNEEMLDKICYGIIAILQNAPQFSLFSAQTEEEAEV